ncbi:MAG: multicopper oxidase domain-containing protein [Bacillota bacterium]
MSVRHYVLLATDGFISLPNTPDICPTPDITENVYVFGFVGGLYRIDNKIINPLLNWENPENWPLMLEMKGTATVPSPMIWAEQGDRLYITLINLGMKYRPDLLDFHTVHMHGAHVATQLDGFPETSFGVPMWMNESEVPPNATYFFAPEHPATYMYHCHIEASEHVQMGMYGGLIIYPSYKGLADAGITRSLKGYWYLNGVRQPQIPKTATNRNFAYNHIDTYFDKEYVMLLSDIDSTWHNSVFNNEEFNAVDYKPDYWLVNGRAFPDTLLPHPQTPPEDCHPDLSQINYESYVHVNTDDKFLLRMINMGYQVVPWHIHGWHFTIVGKDGHPSPFLTISRDLSKLTHAHFFVNHKSQIKEMGFTVTIGSGETYDLLLTADDKRPLYQNYIVRGQNGFPSLCCQMKALQQDDPETIFDIPTDPVECPDPNTVNYVDICNGSQGYDLFFPQFYPMHNHDDYKVTNNGVYPGGQLTYIQTDRPLYEKKDNYTS